MRVTHRAGNGLLAPFNLNLLTFVRLDPLGDCLN